MLLKDDVLAEFKRVRSFERVDLLCSLLDFCLPYELRFLGTCLEFLGKRDFSELREDERDANSVIHLSSFRSLLDESTRRKLVLYVSLLKSCNTDCANCLNETLTALRISDVNQLCRSQPENAEKALDELLLLYTIAVKHPAFNIHQKAEFAEHLRCLEEEDHNLSLILYPADDDNARSSRFSKQLDSIPETGCKSADSPTMSGLNQDISSQVSVISQGNPLSCHFLSSSVYTSAVLPSVLHQASAACLNPAHVMVSAVSSPVIQPPTDGQSPETAQPTQSRLNSDSGHSVIAMGLTPCSVNSGIMMGAGPGPGSGSGMVMPLTPSTSHCMLSTSGDMGSPCHPHMMASVMCVTPESMSLPYPGPSPYGMVPLMGQVPVPGACPPLGCPSASMAPMMNGPAATMAPTPTPTPAPKSASSYPTANSPLCSSNSRESVKYEDDERQASRPPSPYVKVPSPPTVSKTQSAAGKGSAHPPQQMHQHQQPYLGPPNHSHQMPFQIPPNIFPSALPLAQLSPKLNSSVLNHNPPYPNQFMSVGSTPFPSQASHVIIKPLGQWHSPGDNLKEVIVREMPKYKANLQDLSPDELLHMGDDQLKEIGLPANAIQQLRSIMNKLHSTNGMNCLNKNDAVVHSEGSGSRRKHLTTPSDNKAAAPSPVNHGFVVSSSYSGSPNNGASNGNFSKGSKRQQLQITNQVRALQLDDDSRRPASNSSSTSDCSSGSRSPPETPSEARSDNFEKGHSGKDSGAESWNSAASEDKSKEERLHEVDCLPDDRMRAPPHQPPGIQRNSVNRSRGISKAPPGIPTMPRGRGHAMPEKHRRDPGPAGAMNGVLPELPPSSYSMSAPSGMPSNIPYPPTTPVSSFLPTPYSTMHAFHRFQTGSFVPAGTAYHFPLNGEMWGPFPQAPQPTTPFVTAPIVAFSPAHPPPKLSCYNCGRQGHQGSDCKESTFEEITQQGQYHLDYKPGECRDPDK